MNDFSNIGNFTSQGENKNSNILQRVVKNTFWFFNASILGRFLNLLKGIILARLLLPEDFGLFGLAIVVIGFTEMISNIGAGTFLFYKDDGEYNKHKQTAFWVNLLISSSLVVFLILLSPIISRFYKTNELFLILIVLAISLFIKISSNVHRSILLKNLQFRLISIIEVVVSVVSFIVAIYLALFGYGVWSMVLSNLVWNVLYGILIFYFAKWLPVWELSFSALRQIAHFSFFYLGGSIIWYLIQNVDNLLVGKLLGMNALGFYNLSYNYALLPITLIANSIGNVVLPEMGKLSRNLSEFWPNYFKVSKLLIGCVSPIALAMFFLAPDLFPLLFGAKWNEAILPFQILSIYALVRCMWADPFSSLGKFKSGFYFGLITLTLSFFSIYFIGLKFGIVGVAFVVLFLIGAVHIGALLVASHSFGKLICGIKNAFPYIIVALCASIVAYLIKYFIIQNIWSSRLLGIFVFIFIEFLIYGLVFRKNLSEFVAVFAENKKEE